MTEFLELLLDAAISGLFTTRFFNCAQNLNDFWKFPGTEI